MFTKLTRANAKSNRDGIWYCGSFYDNMLKGGGRWRRREVETDFPTDGPCCLCVCCTTPCVLPSVWLAAVYHRHVCDWTVTATAITLPLPLPFPVRVSSSPLTSYPMDSWVLTEQTNVHVLLFLRSVEWSGHCCFGPHRTRTHPQACNGLNLRCISNECVGPQV